MTLLDYPEIINLSDEEFQDYINRMDDRQRAKFKDAIRQTAEIISRFSDEDLRGETSPEELLLKLLGDEAIKTT